MSSSEHDPESGRGVSVNDERGYPCPKDGTILTLIEADETHDAGAWCPTCHTVWREADDVSLKDLDDA